MNDPGSLLQQLSSTLQQLQAVGTQAQTGQAQAMQEIAAAITRSTEQVCAELHALRGAVEHLAEGLTAWKS